MSKPNDTEWFARGGAGEPAGLRFSCTMCGNCCTGPEGFVLVSDAEVSALAKRLGVGEAEFIERYTRVLPNGRSLIERETHAGHDCVFLDRDAVPGQAVCGVYEDRPAQCRTWPFWPSNLEGERSWKRAGAICPGINRGTLHTPAQIRVQRDAFRI